MDPSTHQPSLSSLDTFQPPVPAEPQPPPAPGAAAMPAGRGDGRWHPERWLPLVDPQRPADAPPRLFSGEERYLSRRKIAQRERLQEQTWEAFVRVRQEGEELLYLAPAYQMPPLLHLLGLGVWWVYYHQVALFFTDRRLVEVELGTRGRGLGTRVRSVPWDELSRLRLRGRTLEARGTKRRRHRWKVRLRGDRRLLEQLVPKIAEARVGATPAARPVISHCPSCGHGERQLGTECGSCGTRFRSRRLAAGLALAFPGAGLLFAGHPLLALFDLAGELTMYALACLVVLQTGASVELWASVALFGFLLAMTKLESVHLSTVLVDRTKPLAPRLASAWRTFGLVAAGISVAALALPFVFTGRYAPFVDRDLEIATGGEWEIHRSVADWVGDEQDKRAEWHGPHGEIAEVRAYPLSTLETFDEFSLAFDAELAATTEPLTAGAVSGFRAVEHIDFDGDPVERAIFALYDEQGHDVHVVTLDSEPETVDDALRQMEELLLGGRWVEAAAPLYADAAL